MAASPRFWFTLWSPAEKHLKLCIFHSSYNFLLTYESHDAYIRGAGDWQEVGIFHRGGTEPSFDPRQIPLKNELPL